MYLAHWTKGVSAKELLLHPPPSFKKLRLWFLVWMVVSFKLLHNFLFSSPCIAMTSFLWPIFLRKTERAGCNRWAYAHLPHNNRLVYQLPCLHPCGPNSLLERGKKSQHTRGSRDGVRVAYCAKQSLCLLKWKWLVTTRPTRVEGISSSQGA